VPFLMSRRIRSSCWRCKPFPPPSERDLWSWMRRGYRCDGAITRTSIVMLRTPRAYLGRCGTCSLAMGLLEIAAASRHLPHYRGQNDAGVGCERAAAKTK